MFSTHEMKYIWYLPKTFFYHFILGNAVTSHYDRCYSDYINLIPVGDNVIRLAYLHCVVTENNQNHDVITYFLLSYVQIFYYCKGKSLFMILSP